MADEAVAKAVNDLKSKWTVLKANDPKIGTSKFPGRVMFNIMVATNVKVRFPVPGRVIHMLGLLADDTVDGAKLVDWAKTSGSTDDPDHRNVQSSALGVEPIMGRPVTIYRCPVPITVDRKGRNYVFNNATLRFPRLATVDAINNWIYKHTGGTKPTEFRIYGGRLFKVEDIGDASLGSLSARYQLKA